MWIAEYSIVQKVVDNTVAVHIPVFGITFIDLCGFDDIGICDVGGCIHAVGNKPEELTDGLPYYRNVGGIAVVVS